MSSLSVPFLKIYPPVLSPFTKAKETIYSDGHRCPYCNGKGVVLGKRVRIDEWEYDDCPVCNGTGKVRATIVVYWNGREIEN